MRAALCRFCVADSDHIRENLASAVKFEYALGFVPRDVNPHFPHDLDGQRVKLSRLQAGAEGFKFMAGQAVEEGFGHLAPGAVVDTNEKDSDFFHQISP